MTETDNIYADDLDLEDIIPDQKFEKEIQAIQEEEEVIGTEIVERTIKIEDIDTKKTYFRIDEIREEFGDYAEKLFITRNDQTNQFNVYGHPDQFVKFIKSIDKKSRIYHEIIFGNRPQKIRFDIDFPEPSIKKFDEKFKLSCFEATIEAIVRAFEEVYDIYLSFDDILVYNGTKKQYSRHIIINKYYVSNNSQAREFYKKVVAKLDKKYVSYDLKKKNSKGEDIEITKYILDPMLYSKTANLRIAGNTKLGKGNFKQLIEWDFGDDHVCQEFSFLESFITYVDGCEHLKDIDIPKPVRKQREEHEFNDDDFKLVDILLRKCNLAKRVCDARDWKKLIGLIYGEYGISDAAIDFVYGYSEEFYENAKYDEHVNIFNFYDTNWDEMDFQPNSNLVLKWLKEDNPEAYKEFMAFKHGRRKYNPSDIFTEEELGVISESVVLTQEKCSAFDSEDPYCWVEFYREFHKYSFDTEDEMRKKLLPKIKKVIARVEQGNGLIVKKDDCEEGLFTILKRNDKFTDLYFSYTEIEEKEDEDEPPKEKFIKTTFREFLTEYAMEIPMYKNICCKPGLSSEENKSFNVWQGYKAKLVKEVDMTKVQPWLDYLKEIWAGDNEEVFKYLLTWLHYVLAKPETKTKVAIFAHSPNQGAGKNTFTDFLHKHVIGSATCAEVNGLEPVIQKHNRLLQGKKLLVVNETSSVKESFYADFNKMKNYITDDFLTIEPKGKESYNVDNLLNMIIFSNHANSIMLEKSDRRYFCLDISEKYLQDTAFFKKIREELMDQEHGDHFYTYFVNYNTENLVDIFKPPITELKKDLIESNLPSPIKFLKYVKDKIEKARNKEENLDDVDTEEDSDTEAWYMRSPIKASEFYTHYSTYCEKNKLFKYPTPAKFGIAIRSNIEKYTPGGVTKYKLETIKNA